MEKMKPAIIAPVPSFGLLLKQLFKEKRTHKSVLARLLGVRPQTVFDYEKKNTIQTETIWKLSMLLKHNFLQDLADQLPKEFPSFTPEDTTLQDQIEVLQKENELLKAQLEILERVLRK